MASFRVMTWNVENLFGVGDADGPACSWSSALAPGSGLGERTVARERPVGDKDGSVVSRRSRVQVLRAV